MEKNHAAGFHEAWERELHKALFLARASGREVSFEERKNIVDTAIRKSPSDATNIVCCEFCQEEIAEALLHGKDIFEEGHGVRTLLESYGIRLPLSKRLRLPR